MRTVIVIGLLVVFYCGIAAAESQSFQLWGGAALDDWAGASRAVMITDMTAGMPESALTGRLRKGRWLVLPYELRDTRPSFALGDKGQGPQGKMVWASPMSDAPELKVPLGVEGWYAIFVGLFCTSEAATFAWIKLDTDRAPVPRSNNNNDYYGTSVESFFKVARLDKGSALVVRQQSSGHYPSPCGVTHVRLIPLTPEEIERISAERSDLSHRTAAATCDGFSFIFHRRPTTAEDLLSEVEIFRDTDFGTLILQTFGADKVSYPSSRGHMPGLDMDDWPRIGDRNFVESIRELAAKHINPMKVMIDGAHNAGLKVHIGIRPGGWSFYEPFAGLWETPFYKNNPQWRCADRDGTPVTRMSWAVPEVRKHLIDLFEEMVGFGAEGAHLVFNRGVPMVAYEEPFCQLFKQRYGEDPRKIDESDPRINRLWCEVVTTFFRELRAMLDREQKRRGDGKRLEISAMVLGDEKDNLRYGIDARQLIADGLIDELYADADGMGSRRGEYDLKFFREVCAPKNIPFRPVLRQHLGKRIEQVSSFYEAGAAGVAVWDAGVGDLYAWSTICARLGHREELERRLKELPNKPPQKVYYFHRAGEIIMDGRYPPWWGG